MLDRCRLQVITVDEIRILRQDGRRRNPHKLTTYDTLPRFGTPTIQLVLK